MSHYEDCYNDRDNAKANQERDLAAKKELLVANTTVDRMVALLFESYLAKLSTWEFDMLYRQEMGGQNETKR